MSTDWGYRCETCHEDSPTWFPSSTGVEDLEVFLEFWPKIRDVFVAVQYTNRLWRVRLEVIGENESPGVLHFLHEHDGHHLVIVNEYGHTAAEWEKR